MAWAKKKQPLTLDEHHFEQLHKYTKTRRVSKGQMGGNDFINQKTHILDSIFNLILLDLNRRKRKGSS